MNKEVRSNKESKTTSNFLILNSLLVLSLSKYSYLISIN